MKIHIPAFQTVSENRFLAGRRDEQLGVGIIRVHNPEGIRIGRGRRSFEEPGLVGTVGIRISVKIQMFTGNVGENRRVEIHIRQAAVSGREGMAGGLENRVIPAGIEHTPKQSVNFGCLGCRLSAGIDLRALTNIEAQG